VCCATCPLVCECRGVGVARWSIDDGEGQLLRSLWWIESGEGWTRRLGSRDQEAEDGPWMTRIGCMEEQEFTLVMGDESIDKSQG